MSNARSPLEALQEETSKFNRRPAAVVTAELRVVLAEGREVFGEISTVGSDSDERHLEYEFYLTRPFADCAPHLLFKVWHHILFKAWYHLTHEYPLNIQIAGDGKPIELESEEELVGRTRKILSSERTQEIIQSMSV